jgi:pimeloyl-ACP methyl ester carboxylesterase
VINREARWESAPGLLVCDTGAGSDELQPLLAKIRRRIELLETQGVEAFADEFMSDPALSRFAGTGPAAAALVRLALTSCTAHGLAGTPAGVVDNRPSIYSLGPRLAALRVPTIIIVGEGDDYCTKVYSYMAQTIPGAELVVIRETGHLANLEQPKVFNAAVERFLHRVWAVTPAAG